ncbi:MAG: T9SS type A sorting domain-containing protein, partial [Bacteroides nordii]
PLYSKDKKEIVKTEIYDIRGMLMTTFGTNEEVVIDNLEKGVYVVRQTDKEGNVTVEKMMNR